MMMPSLVAILLAGPPVSDALADMTAELNRAQAVLNVMERRAAGEHFATLRVREHASKDFKPWALQATLGISFMRGEDTEGIHAVTSDSGMSFTLLPNTEDLQGDTQLEVEVCRGAVCHNPSWQWTCSRRGACAAQGRAGDMLGGDAGTHLLTIVLRAECAGFSQEWKFTAAAAGT